jgi:hypothetical protein
MSYLPTILSTLYLSIGVALLNSFPWQLIFLYTKSYGIRCYSLMKKEECKRIQKKIGNNTSHMTDNNKGVGYAIGYWYIMNIDISINDGAEQYKIMLIATESSYRFLIKDDEEDDDSDDETNHNSNNILEDNSLMKSSKPKKNINIWQRLGSHNNRWYRKRTIKVPKLIALAHQQPIIKTIIDYYDENKHAVVFLHGSPGSGKSIIGILLTNYYSSSYCESLQLWKPGDSFDNIYTEVEPTEEKPLIILLNEIDIGLIEITKGVPDHKNIDISIQNKTGWNNLFDSINLGMYPNVIIIMTSNKTPKFINDLDPSYLRSERVDFIFEVEKN